MTDGHVPVNLFRSTSSLKRSTQQGQMFVYFAVMLLALIGMAALISDVPLYFRERSRMQAAADSAALAAAMELDHLLLSELNFNVWSLCITQYLGKCELPPSAAAPYCAQYPAASCSVNYLPLPLNTVTVTMTRVMPTLFSGALGFDGITIRVTAHAAMTVQY